ncbi:hypothetical protein C0584_00340 [Candidatus Parcubacteria bacterium]|nr:MAG: hypothetical protein C0584_00340 [Candidatus Parcubacteria bacterium]
MSLDKKKIKLAFSIIFLLEIFSLFSFLFPELNSIFFVTIVLFVFIVSLKKIEYGLWFSFAELIIGSKGYLFYIGIGGLSLSIRIGIWFFVMLAFFIKLSKLLKEKYYKDLVKRPSYILEILQNFLKSTYYLKYFFVLFLFILYSLIVAFISGNDNKNIFFDFNAWMFLSYIFPVYFAYHLKRNDLANLYSIIIGALSWVSFKTFFLLYIFSHNIISILPAVYSWVRKSGVGEITRMDSGFSRIFFQSHIYFIPLFIFLVSISLYYFINNKYKKSVLFKFLYFSSIVSLSINLITLSRSNWVGVVLSLALIFLFVLIFFKIKKTVLSFILIASMFMFSVGLISLIVKFPFPDPSAEFSTSGLLSERAKQISSEAGVSSRWSLLKPLISEIGNHPIMGSGFGSTVTYVSSDPRVLEMSPSGEYTTYAFEWGWLDIWLKFGFFGLLFYLYLLFKIFIFPFSKKMKPNNINSVFIYSMAIGLFALSAVNFFSPYFNHPLGIAYLILISIIFDRELLNND